MKSRITHLLRFALMFTPLSWGQPDTTRMPPLLYGVPYLYYTPETDWAFGGTGILTFRPGDDPALNPSSLTLDAYYTVKKQFKTSLMSEIFLNDNRMVVSGSIEYGRIVDKFWGIGPLTEDSDSTEYVKGMFRLQGRAQLILFERLKCGILLEFDRTWMIDKLDNRLLRQNAVAGSDGSTSSGTGLVLSWDTRDNIFFPTNGSYHQLEHTIYGAYLGSDHSFQRTLLDLRAYYDIGTKHIIAFQGGGLIVHGSPPFTKLAPLGGDAIMRGYYLGRYRDTIYLAVQTEYRKMVFTRLGIALFLGIGDVATNFSSFRLKHVKPSYGTGLRFMLDPKEQLTIRIDVGFGRGTDGVYLAVKEAF